MAKSKKKQPVDDWEDLPAAAPAAAPQDGADDWQDVTDAPAAKPKNPSELRAMLRAGQAGIAQAATLGYAPRLIAKGAEFLSSFQPDVIDPKTGKAIPRVDYKTARDASYKDLADIEAAAPKSFMAGNFAGSMAIPGGAAKSVAGAGLRAALQAAAYNPGDHPGEDSGLQLGERATQGVFGGLFGAGAKVAGDAIGAGARAYLAKRAMNRPGFSRGVQDEIKNAAQQLEDKYIAPRAEQVNDALQGTEVSFRPDILKGTHGARIRAASRSCASSSISAPATPKTTSR
jgi:hypothetical protein